MKILKYSFAILVVSMIANIAMASAAVTLRPDQWGVSGDNEIAPGKIINSIEVKKERIATQNFFNYYTNTPITIPCENCRIKAVLQKNVNGKWDTLGSKTVKMKQRGYFNGNTSEAPGTYRLRISRADVTLVPTIVIWEWYIQDRIQ